MDRLKQITIRDAKPNDLVALTSLMNELGYPTEKEEMEVRMEHINLHPDFRTFIADFNSHVVGFMGLSKNFSYEENGIYIRILALVVHKSARGNGVGFELIKTVENWAKEIGANRIILTCGNREERNVAHIFYRKMGFEIQSTGYIKRFRLSE